MEVWGAVNEEGALAGQEASEEALLLQPSPQAAAWVTDEVGREVNEDGRTDWAKASKQARRAGSPDGGLSGVMVVWLSAGGVAEE